MSHFPELRTPRLILRNFTPADALSVFRTFSDPRVTEFYDLDTITELAQAERLVEARQRMNATADGPGRRWAICLEQDEKTVIGSCGCHAINRRFRSLEIGYELHPDYWRQGFAHEAVGAMLDFLYSEQSPVSVNRIAATTNLDSHASIALLRKLGFSEEGILRQFGFWQGQYHDVRVFSLLREEWRREHLRRTSGQNGKIEER